MSARIHGGESPYATMSREGVIEPGAVLDAPRICKLCQARVCAAAHEEADLEPVTSTEVVIRTCARGADFAVLRVQDFSLVLPGLMVSGHDGDRSRRLKKELQATKVERKQIEAWWKAQVRALAEVDQEVAERVRQTLEMFHDVQTAASSIIRSAERLQAAQLGRNDDEKFAALHPAAQTLVKAASLLELRMRTMPIVSNPAAASYGRRIRKPIYKLIDMLVRTLQPLAERRGVSLELRGVSHKMTDVFESFDLLPLTLIENAIKYSAKGQAIEVVVQDTESGIAVSVASFSPWIAPEERQSIFKRRYRAESAITMLAEGSGLGLHIAEVVARAHNTHVLFGTDEGNVMLDGIRYAGNRFSFSTR